MRASRQLVEHNRQRFPKIIEPTSSSNEEAGALRMTTAASQAAGAAVVARRLTECPRGEVVVLARTTNLLGTVALACIGPGVRISAPEKVFEARGARRAVEAYLRPCSAPGEARPEDVVAVLRAPSRGLPPDGEAAVAQALHQGAGFAQSRSVVVVPANQRRRLDQAGEVLDRLSRIGAAAPFVRELRGSGGLDKHYEDSQRAMGDVEQVDLEQLEQLEREAAGESVPPTCGFSRSAPTPCSSCATTSTASSSRPCTVRRVASGPR